MRMMAASAYRCLPRTSGVPSAAHCGIRDEDRARFRVLPVGLGAGSRRSFENGRVGQCISKWASGEFRRRVFGQRNAVALPYRPGRRELKVVAEEKFDVAKAAGFLVKTGKNALDAGTNLVPESIPRGVARIIVGLVGASVVTYALRALFSTALFILAIAGFSYLAYMYLNKDSDSGSGGGGGGKPRNTDDSLEEARRIMEKYK
ncbi:uncharacterized protein [Physcomitrium patens]|uniref:Uncharacterized protein n=2 Tax=Physcomitrium patens TaxID=3218 RepID=A0A2K1IDB4_PHYPA|nr:uncharacterized protein LOC112277609 [Physcomitrium patens]PNR27257.1 hypothetical protein PHYPA_029409 [Physcomitrium patens]|eukprot:XP_024365919.1 uncharacterized protein LOC112277609 [Physcomitrella patens]